MGYKDLHDEELAEASASLERVYEALFDPRKGSMNELIAAESLPPACDQLVEAVCHMCEVQPIVVETDEEVTQDYWTALKSQILSDSRVFRWAVQSYDKETVSASALAKVMHICNDPVFNPEHIRHASEPAAVLCSWVLALVSYARAKDGKEISSRATTPANPFKTPGSRLGTPAARSATPK
jgi:hypothetical protein